MCACGAHCVRVGSLLSPVNVEWGRTAILERALEYVDAERDQVVRLLPSGASVRRPAREPVVQAAAVCRYQTPSARSPSAPTAGDSSWPRMMPVSSAMPACSR
jgi:hypothetical protein